MKTAPHKTPLTQHNKDRLRRAESWLERSRKIGAEAKQAKSPEDKAALACEQFIFLWIAFNAAYGQEPLHNNSDGRHYAEAKRFNDFLKKILDRDPNGDIKTILWDTYFVSVQDLLDNRYVFGPFWDYVRGDKKNWENLFKREKSRAYRTLGNEDDILTLDEQDILHVLKEIFHRLYELRNQIFHGGVTTGAGWGQSQLEDGSRIMASLVPKILEIMRADVDANPASETWGNVAYPRINKEQDKYTPPE